MHIERRYTKDSQSPYAGIAFTTTKSEIRNPDGSVVFSLDGIEVPAGWSQVAADVLAQKYFRKAGVPARLKSVEEEGVPVVPVALGRRRGGARGAAEGRALRLGDLGQAGVRPPRRRLGLLGLEGRLFRHAKTTRAPISTRCAACWRARWPRPIRRNGSTPASTGPMASTGRGRATITSTPTTGKLDAVEVGLRASAAARLLHPVGRRRPRQRGRHHGPVGARGAPVQIRLGHRLQLLRAARREREAFGRRPLLGPDVAS